MGRLLLAAGASVLLVSSLAGCSIPGILSGEGGSSSRSAASSDDLQSVTSAVLAADSRVTDASGTVSYSGAARTLTVAVIMSGEDPVTTSTLTAVLIAVRDATPTGIQTITVIARKAADEEKILDLSGAIAGLPKDVTPLWDGGVTLSRVDLEKLKPAQ
ncbi:hypothetical protein IT072_11845 [Leifsonia sp. ZF2019]|nr:hypothetical protein IT072_11845 [Leifsonia sp. ZF2019]